MAVLLSLATLACCKRAPPVNRPYPPPSAAELLQTIRAQQAAVRSMNAKVRATSWIGGQRLRATVLMLVERSGRLRFEAEVSLQGTVSILTTDNDRFSLLDLQKNELSRGSACPENVASMIRIPLAPAEVAAILLGDVKVASEDGAVTWDPGVGGDVLTLEKAVGTPEMRLTFQQNDPAGRDRRLVAVSAHGPDGRRLWRVSYEDPENANPGGGGGAVRLPGLIRFAEGEQSFDDGVEIKFKDRTLNVALRDQDFTLVAPAAGVKTIEVGCGDSPSLERRAP
jgi:hypothetical protein